MGGCGLPVAVDMPGQGGAVDEQQETGQWMNSSAAVSHSVPGSAQLHAWDGWEGQQYAPCAGPAAAAAALLSSHDTSS
jgi:hypothetical protein